MIKVYEDNVEISILNNKQQVSLKLWDKFQK